VYGAVPPEAVAVKVTCWPACGDDGENVKLVVRAGGALVLKNSVIGLAFASLDVKLARFQLASIVRVHE
jgi:hypothetical protein